ADLVSYSFELLSGDYLTTYKHELGFNPENSYVETDTYRLHFSDRWIHDGLEIRAPGAVGEDVLDRHGFQFQPGLCVRTEETFSEGFGAIIANVDGPVRAIRSVIGANSGRLTERQWLFYPDVMKVVTDVRVHQVPGVWDFYDYAPAAIG